MEKGYRLHNHHRHFHTTTTSPSLFNITLLLTHKTSKQRETNHSCMLFFRRENMYLSPSPLSYLLWEKVWNFRRGFPDASFFTWIHTCWQRKRIRIACYVVSFYYHFPLTNIHFRLPIPLYVNLILFLCCLQAWHYHHSNHNTLFSLSLFASSNQAKY